MLFLQPDVNTPSAAAELTFASLWVGATIAIGWFAIFTYGTFREIRRMKRAQRRKRRSQGRWSGADRERHVKNIGVAMPPFSKTR